MRILHLLLSGSITLSAVEAFVPSLSKSTFLARFASSRSVDTLTEKPTGTSFLPEETIERASKGSPIEKIKLEKDGTSAFVDVYEYARKIRQGEMTWEEVEKADLDTVSRQPTSSLFSIF